MLLENVIGTRDHSLLWSLHDWLCDHGNPANLSVPDFWRTAAGRHRPPTLVSVLLLQRLGWKCKCLPSVYCKTISSHSTDTFYIPPSSCFREQLPLNTYQIFLTLAIWGSGKSGKPSMLQEGSDYCNVSVSAISPLGVLIISPLPLYVWE